MTAEVITTRPEIIVLGASAGGLHAIERVLRSLPRGFPVPIVVVQHRSKESSDAYTDVVGKSSLLPVREIEDGDALRAPGVYIAPPDYHVLIEPGRTALSIDDPVSYSRPSIDVLFESAADTYGARVVAVLLTGANADGARGLRRVKEAGGYAIVQNPQTAESPEMPAAGIAMAPVDLVLELDGIASALVQRAAIS